MNALRTYLTGFGHEVAHDEYVTLGEFVGDGRKKAIANGHGDAGGGCLTENEQQGIELLKEERKEVQEREKCEVVRPIWVRPAHDGLRIRLTADGEVNDETYDS